MSDGDLRWLADHMGHNIDIHREFYRLRESTKVSRILLAIDEGKAHNFSGKKISDIDIEGKHLVRSLRKGQTKHFVMDIFEI